MVECLSSTTKKKKKEFELAQAKWELDPISKTKNQNKKKNWGIAQVVGHPHS
jgi:hypothetical protein